MGNYQEIISTGFDIEEILKSYNQQLSKKQKEEDGKKNPAKGFSAEKIKEKGTGERKKEKSDKEKGSGDLLVAEEKDTGRIMYQDIKNYIGYSYGNKGIVMFVTFQVLCALCQLYSTYWVSYWTERDFEEQ